MKTAYNEVAYQFTLEATRKAEKRAAPLSLGYGDRANPELFKALTQGYRALHIMACMNDFEAIKQVMLDDKKENGVRQVALEICRVVFPDMEVPVNAPFADYFEVAAGKYEYDDSEEGQYKNYKTIDSRKTLAEALDLVEECRGYHFIELEYVDVNGVRNTLELSLKA